MLRYFSIASLLAIAAIALALGIGYERLARDNLITLSERNNQALTQLFANALQRDFAGFLSAAGNLQTEELQRHPMTAALHEFVLGKTRGLRIVKVKVYALNGKTIFSTEPAQIGADQSTNPGFVSARRGTPISELTQRDQFSTFEQTIFDRSLVSSYVPMLDATGETIGVVEVYDDVTDKLELIAGQRTRISVIVVGALLALYLALLTIVLRAERMRRDAEASLRTIMNELEARVAERTTELTAANARMHEEVSVRRRAESKLESKRDLLVSQQTALSAVLRSEPFRTGALDDTLRLITETAAHALCAGRVSIWRLQGDGAAIECLDLFECAANRHSSGLQLLRTDYPRYFAALALREEIVAHDAHEDPRTSEFSEHYLKPLGIGAMLDAPIVRNGEVVGVICHEHVGAPTAWTPEQRLFALAAANLAALALEQADRSHTEQQLRETSARLSGDIEERKRIERELRESQRLMASLLHNTSEGFWHIDNAANTVDVNPAMCGLLGRPREAIIGRNIFEFVDAHNAAVFRHEIEARRRGMGGPYEVALQRPDGTNIPCLNNATPIHDESGVRVGSVGLWVDISQMKHTQMLLERAKDDALAASRAKSAFLAAMSHEIRTPLNGIVSIIEILADGELRQEQRFQIGLARQAAAQLLNLIGNVLDLSKLESERLELESIPFDLDEVINAAVDTFTIEASRKGLQLLVDTDRLERKLRGDPTRLKQIVLNLVGNAIKFTASGRITVRAAIAVANDAARVQLTVSDTGIGIPAEALPRLMEKFVQASATTSREYGGSGLGLAICKQLSEAMGGTLRIESELGKGSRFIVDLTIPMTSEPSAPPSARSGAAVSVLTADEALFDSLAKLLRSEGFDVGRVNANASDQATESRVGAPLSAIPVDADHCLMIDEAMFDACAGPALLDWQDRAQRSSGRLVALVAANLDATRLQRSGMAHASILMKPLTRTKIRGWYAETKAAPASPARSTDTAVNEAAQPIALLVEDNPTNRYVARQHLARLGWRVAIAEDGARALEITAIERFDVILMDVFMPNVDGLEATRQIRALPGPNQHVPIIALTANAFADDVRACLEAGMNTHLAKPVSRQALAAALQAMTVREPA